MASAPLRTKLCRAGKASDVSGDGPWYWNCFGDNGGAVSQCTAYTLIGGACGPASNVPASKTPTTGLCATGKHSAVTGDGPWYWSCRGSGEGTTINCSAPAKRDGRCGIANTIGTAERPATNLCTSGTPTAVMGEGPWIWTCRGEGGGALATCSAPLLMNAACGPAHGVGVATIPQRGLCASGDASDITGDGPWMWTCYGNNGGSRVNCMAPRKLDGICGAANKMEADEIPMENLCASGLPSPVIGTGPWQWTCQGDGGGITVNCGAERVIPAACGSAHGVGSQAAPNGNLCASGLPTSVVGGGKGPWLWSCNDSRGKHPVNCMAPLMVNGMCGSAIEMPVNAPPTADLCRVGAPSEVSGNGPWNWTCEGAGGGVTVSCQVGVSDAPPQTAEEQAAPAASAAAAANGGKDCVPSVKRWTITCQQGGYPANFAGVIVGETQVLCPTAVERGVWLSNSCAASTQQPVSPEPGVLVTPPTPKLGQLPPLPIKRLEPPTAKPKLNTPRFSALEPAEGEGAGKPMVAAADQVVTFTSGSEGLDGNATSTLDRLTSSMQNDSKSIITLNAYAAMPKSNDPQEARRLALARALAVRSYMMSRGIANNRIDVRAVGPAGDGRGDDRVDIAIGQ
jgi:outer membrane protein OmpA-like peptidoglycan-associated protein